MKGTIKAPSSLKDITLRQYQEYLKLAKDLEGDDLARVNVAVFCGINQESVNYIRLQDVRDISEEINNLFSMDQTLSPTIDVNGVKMGFINDLENMSFGEYVDLDKYVNDWDSMHGAMAVLYRPITEQLNEKYTIVDYGGTGEYAEYMKEMSLESVLGSMVFFYALGSELLRLSLIYSVKEVEEQIIALPHNSTKNGVGILQYTHSLKETIRKLKMPLEEMLSLHSRS